MDQPHGESSAGTQVQNGLRGGGSNARSALRGCRICKMAAATEQSFAAPVGRRPHHDAA